MKKYIVITIILFIIILGFFTGVYLYKINKIGVDEEVAKTDKGVDISKIEEKSDLSASNSEEKISPNCTIVLKIYYKECNHLIETKKNVEEAQVNMTEEELKEKFKEWEVQKFTERQIVLYKEIDGFCNEHYILKEKNGKIAIFKIDRNNNQTFLKNTEIAIQYLPEEDLKSIQKGIIIYTKKELNKVIEDFE